MDFHSPALADKENADKAFLKGQPTCCEYCFGNIYMWAPIYNNKMRCDGGLFVSGDFTERPVYCYPCGEGDKKGLIESLIKDNNGALSFYGLTEKDKEELNSFFPDMFKITEERDYFDYLYLTEDLAKLAGRKYHSKRNHISFFESNYKWHYEPISRDNIKDCIMLSDHWEGLNAYKSPEEISNEHSAIKRAFNNYFDLGLEGGILTVENDIVAFTFGERLNDSTFCTHIEKAYGDIRGAYQMINRELARQLSGRYEYINREDDTGSEGLRSAKLSYHPHRLIVKYSAEYGGEL